MKKRIVQLFGMGAAFVFLLGLVTPSLAVTVSLLSKDPDLKAPLYIATDGVTLFVTGVNSSDTQSIFSLPIGGGKVSRLYPAFNPNEITIIGSNLFWIDPNSGPITDTQILRAPKSGAGPITAIYTGSLVGQPIVDGVGITTDGVKLYTADEVQGRVHRLSPDGSGLT